MTTKQKRLRLRSVCVLVLMSLTTASGCRGYSSVSEFEQTENRKSRFQDVVKEIGGTAEHKYYQVAGKEGLAWKINLAGAKFEPRQADEFLDTLQAMGYIAEVDLSGSSITDEQLIKFDEAKYGRVVMDLNLSNTAISDAAIDKLENFYCLKNVDLTGTKVTQPAVDRFIARRKQNPLTQV
ncbi:MAG: hypothetical protein KF861_18965, partial [Planctomycetaceae bacterium]|nr:hypothetical protein [Planctomycetaceae bacterium]